MLVALYTLDPGYRSSWSIRLVSAAAVLNEYSQLFWVDCEVVSQVEICSTYELMV